MPYVSPERRQPLDTHIGKLTLHDVGDLNYVITRLLVKFLNARGAPNYERYNAAIGVLECAKQELYARVVRAYEDEKRKANGDVYG